MRMPADYDPELAAIRRRMMTDLLAAPEPAAAAAPAPAWPDAPVPVTDADFDDVVGRYPLALVDFWAPWCGPCRIVAPSIEELAREMSGRVAFLKLNTDENPRTAARFRVQSIPTLLIMKDGVPADVLVGALPKPQISMALRRYAQRRGTPGPRRL